MSDFKLKPKSFVGGIRPNQHGFLSEDRMVKSLGMKSTGASGAGAGDKSDGYNHKFRVECKSTMNKTLSLEHEWLLKVKHEAMETGKEPILTVSFVNGKGVSKKDGDWVLMEKSLFAELTEG